MSIVIRFNCDQLVPDGVCGATTYVPTDSVTVAIGAAEQAGWYVGVQASGEARRRVRCPNHGGRRQR